MRPLSAAASAVFLCLALPGLAGPPGKNAERRLPSARSAQTAPVSPADDPAQALLKQMLRAENSLALSGDQVTTVARNGLDISSEQQVQRSGAHALRLDYLRPARLAGEQIVDNGHFLCHYFPALDTLEIAPSRIQALHSRVPQVIRQIRTGRLVVESMGQETVAGHLCSIVQVSARSEAPVPRRRFWIDPTNGAQLRIEQYDAAGQLQSASYYTQVTYNPVFDRDTFKLPHAGSKVVTRGFSTPALTLEQVRQQAGLTLLTPSSLPDAYHFQAGSVSDLRKRRVVELRYTNGVNVLSVFLMPDAAAGGATKVQHPRRGVLYGRQAGMKVVIIGNLEDAEMEKVLNSLR